MAYFQSLFTDKAKKPSLNVQQHQENLNPMASFVVFGEENSPKLSYHNTTVNAAEDVNSRVSVASEDASADVASNVRSNDDDVEDDDDDPVEASPEV
jgi:hypothetical protein